MCPLPGDGRPWCPEQEAPQGTTGRPSSSPKGARKRFLAILGERSSRCLRGAEAAPRRPRFPVKCSGLRRWVSCGSGCIYLRGAQRPFYSPRAQEWKGWCLCGGAVFPGYEMRIHLCEDHKADRLVATVARSTRWPDSINYSENHHYHCNSTIMFLLPLFAVNLRNSFKFIHRASN